LRRNALRLLRPTVLPRDCGIVTVIDGHPATLGWLGSVRGHRVEALGVEHFGPTGTIDDLYRNQPRCQRHHRRGGRSHRRRPGAASQDDGVIFRRPRGDHVYTVILRSRALARRLEGWPRALGAILRGSPKTASTSG
jgi:hypothetical protein